MNLLRNIFLKIFGLKTYLSCISSIYICATKMGCWKKKYPELFYLDTIIKKGDTCIDIGANLGYYTTRMAKLTGPTGSVFAVEPIPLFCDVWTKNVKPHVNKHVTLLPYALGKQESTVQMGIPLKNGRIHHGMTKITETAQEEYVNLFSVQMKNPETLFLNLSKIDFIKCDVEGYESVVFEAMTEVIKKFKPLVQTELGGAENRTKVIEFFISLGYTLTVLRNNSLQKITVDEAMTLSQDFYFLP